MSSFKIIYWFAYYGLDSPSVRYRAANPLRYLRATYGINYHLVIPGYHPSKIWIFLLAYCSALFSNTNNAMIVIQRVHSNFIYANLLKFLVWLKPTISVYDIDDADHLDFPDENIKWFIKNCAAFNAGSQQLKKTFLPLNTNIHVSTSPTVRLNIRKVERNKLFNIGWIGFFGGGHKHSMLKDVFPAILQLPFPVKLTVLGVHKLGGIDSKEENELRAYFHEADHVELEIPKNINWHDEVEVQERIVKFDVGIATLINDEFHLSKSGFKAKQYMNNGVPVLSTPLPENTTFVDDGYNGFLCSSPEEYLEQLCLLKTMTDEDYTTLSANAITSIDGFDHESYANNLSQLYTQYIK